MTDPVRVALETARERVRQGDLAGAEALYREVLSADPAQPEPLHALGRIALRTGRDAEAVPLLEEALRRRPGPQGHADLAVALQNLGRNAEAAAAARRALELDPRQVSALNTLGNALRGLGRPAEAADCLGRAAGLEPRVAVLRLNLALALRDAGALEDAASAAGDAARLDARDPQAHLLLASLSRRAGRLEEAEAAARRAVALRPSQAETHHALGRVLFDAGRREEAEACYRRALETRPGYAEARYNLGHLLRESGRLAAAHAEFARAVATAPAFAEARVRLAQACAALERHDEAVEQFARAAELLPESPEVRSGLGNALRALGRSAEAEAAYRAAVALRPEFAEGCANLSTVALDQGRLAEATEWALRAIAADPESADPHWNLAQAYLAGGDFARGWRKHEYRLWKQGAAELEFPFPPWNGEPLPEGTLFVTAEQGVGDEILFASCVPDAIAAARRCVVECDARLVPLFARSFPGVLCVARLARAEDYAGDWPRPDARIAIGSLPRFFREDLDAFPERESYLVPDPVRVAAWRRRFESLGDGLKVGISWRGGKDPFARRARSIDLPRWAALGAVAGVSLVNLQYGDVREELEAARRAHGLEVHHWDESRPLEDLDDFAAQVAALDLVISIDNATVHLAGALGTPAWALLPAVADWRWMREREDSPWYASVRLFRRRDDGDIDELMARVRESLARRAAGRLQAAAMRELPSLRRPPAAPRRRTSGVCLVNDTSHWYHWGCTGTSEAIVRTLERRGYAVGRLPITGLQRLREAPETAEAFDDPALADRFLSANAALLRELAHADHLVINGEGTLHGTGPQVTRLLYLAWVAKRRLGKDVQIVNHSCYPEGVERFADSAAWTLYRKVYQAIDRVVVREPASLELLQRAGIAATQAFDCLPLHVRAHPVAVERRRDEVVLAGSVALREADLDACAAFVERGARRKLEVRVLIGARMFPAPEDRAFVAALEARVPGRFEVVDADSIQRWLETIARAGTLVSGRFHHTIAAAALRTPFVLLESNTPKNAGLAAALGAPAPLPLDHPRLAEELEARTGVARESAAGPERLDALCDLAMRNFDALPAL